ncbi:hypothetical protein HPB52_024616 [Rhipicephalus sanguineus]|uniref:FAS1 domain-containing protein n=1 Tax=Rhipicephalus sanguineus TaxID=34632 RepID=A0A9D4YRU7_RHISA|nr:hypothetical protein HPB52_024616 [Rhipicephalus sanguineus]
MVPAENSIYRFSLGMALVQKFEKLRLLKPMSNGGIGPGVWKAAAVNATAVQADIGATNGVIHIIDRVLGMPSHTIYEKISSDPELKDTRRFAQHKGWIERLKNTDKRYTFFAPSDNAWHDIKLEFPSEYKQLSMDQFGYHAEKVGTRHLIVGREIPQMELENLKSIETARGKMDVRNVNGKIHLLWEGREAVVVRPDVQATNGVIHVISKVMMLRRDMTRRPPRRQHRSPFVAGAGRRARTPDAARLSPAVTATHPHIRPHKPHHLPFSK